MKRDALMAGDMEMQAVLDRDVDLIFRCQSPVVRILQIVGREAIAGLAGGRVENVVIRIVQSIPQELQHQDRMDRSALPQIDLDRMVSPPLPFLDGIEINAEAAEHVVVAERCRRPPGSVLSGEANDEIIRHQYADNPFSIPLIKDIERKMRESNVLSTEGELHRSD